MLKAIVLSKSVKIIPHLCRLLWAGEVVAAPTETAYGLLADAFNPRAVLSIVKIKGRGPGKPIALVAGSLGQVESHFYLTATERRLVRLFWPGPLTLLLKPRRKLSSNLVSSGGLVGVRIPDSSWLRRLIKACDCLLTATSANRTGQPAVYSAAKVQHELGPHGLKYLVTSHRLRPRPTSTVVKLGGAGLTVVRPGAVSLTKLRRALPSIIIKL